jgi:hypothetical protein
MKHLKVKLLLLVMGFPFLLFVTMEMMLRPTVVNSKVYQLRGRNFALNGDHY